MKKIPKLDLAPVEGETPEAFFERTLKLTYHNVQLPFRVEAISPTDEWFMTLRLRVATPP